MGFLRFWNTEVLQDTVTVKEMIRAALDDSHSPSFRGPALMILDEVASRSYFVAMRAVGLKALKDKLSEYVRLAASGERVLVTDRDRVVAELVPPNAGRSLVLADAFLAEAVRRGWITPLALPKAEPPPRAPVAPLQELLQELAQDRQER